MTDIATNLSTIDGSLSDIKTAIVAKGVTPSGNITTFATAIGQISGGGSTGKYQLLERVKDDSNNEIGTVSGFFTDANNVEYAVVCLDAQYRLASGTWTSANGAVTNLTEYGMNGAAVDLITNTYTDTASDNCNKILDWCTTNNYTSTSVSHCRSKSFVIDETTYYGQLPNLCELFNIIANRTEISNKDTSKSSYPTLDIATLPDKVWSSSQFNEIASWLINNYGYVTNTSKTSKCFVLPILEIPNNTPSGTTYYAWDTGADVFMTAEENPTTSSTVYILSDGIIYNISQQYNASISSVSGNTIDILASFLPEGGPVTATRDSSKDMTINYTPVIPN